MIIASLLLCSSVALTSLPQPAPSRAVTSVRLAKDTKKKAAGKKAGPAEKAAPEGARVDPRAAPPPEAAVVPGNGESARRGMARIEFDDRLVQGQTNKANAIYLFERRASSMRSLLHKRADFHEEIDETLE